MEAPAILRSSASKAGLQTAAAGGIPSQRAQAHQNGGETMHPKHLVNALERRHQRHQRELELSNGMHAFT